MQCPNCGNKVYEGDAFCGECGFPLKQAQTMNTEPTKETINGEQQKITETETTGTTTENYTNYSNQQQHNQVQNQGPSPTSIYLKEVFSFLKRAIIRPDNIVGQGAYIKPSIPLGAFFSLILIHAILLFLTIFTGLAKLGFSNGISFPFGGFIGFIIVHVLIYVVFFFITYLLVKTLTRNSLSMNQILVDFTATSIVIVSLFVIQMLLGFFGALFGGMFGALVSGLGAIFAAIGAVLFIFAPVYIFMRHAEGRTTRIDRFYSIVIYSIVASVISLIFLIVLSTLLLSLSVDSFMNSFDSMSPFDIFDPYDY